MKTEEKLRNELNPKYDWLFWYLGRLEHGVKFLVGLRRDILVILPFERFTNCYPTILLFHQHTSMFFKMLEKSFARAFDGFCWSSRSPCTVRAMLIWYYADL